MRRWLWIRIAVAFCALPATIAEGIAVDFADPKAVEIVGYQSHAMEPFISRDGRYLLFNNRNDPSENTDLHWAERLSDLSFRYRGRIEGVNTDALEGVPSLDHEGTLYFISPRSTERPCPLSIGPGSRKARRPVWNWSRACRWASRES
jgi:hypothetical protein